MNKIIKISVIILLFLQNAVAQDERNDNFIAFGANYGIDFPSGDLSDRFGNNFHAGLSMDIFHNKFNGIFSIEGAIIFGDNVKEDVLSPLRLSNGAILGSDGSYGDVFLRERGSYLGLFANKIVVPTKNNRHSGLAIGFGIGILQHKIRIQVDSNNTPQFNGDYQKGYDRNTMGVALKQKIGFLNIGKRKSVNYELAFTITEGFTKLTRSTNFDTGFGDNDMRLDLLFGLDFKWFFPFSSQTSQEEEYFY